MTFFERALPRKKTRQELRKQERQFLIWGLLISDACIVAISLAAAYIIRFHVGVGFFNEGFFHPSYYALLIGFLIPLYLILFSVYGLYDHRNLLGGTTEYARYFNAILAGFVLTILINFIEPDLVIARAWLLLAWFFMVCLGLGNRCIMRRIIYRQRRQGHFVDRTLVVGANPEGLAVAEQLQQSPSSGAHLVGFVDEYLSAGSEPIAGIPVLGKANTFKEMVEKHSIETVVIVNNAITREKLLNIYSTLDSFQNVEVRLASGLFELLTSGVRVREEGHVPLVVLNKTRITGIHLFCKTLLDYTAASFGLLLMSPLLLVLYLIVKFTSPGPVIYHRRVVGQRKTEFNAFKFRTMYINGNQLLSEEQKRELEEHGKLFDDPRITPVGKFLRRYSLDELPQLMNVLRGEMSLIGPRMITKAEMEKFGKWQHNLATVKPGLTGLWQVSGRSDLSYEERVRLDMHYIRNHSIWLDLKILYQTIPALVFGRGAY